MGANRSQAAIAEDCFAYNEKAAEKKLPYCTILDGGCYISRSPKMGCFGCPFYKPKFQYLQEREEYGI